MGTKIKKKKIGQGKCEICQYVSNQIYNLIQKPYKLK